MKKAKLNSKETIKPEKEEYSLKSFIIIIVVLVVIFGIFYLITSLIIKPKEVEYNNTDNGFEFSFTEIIMNHLLDRKEDEYYVIATKKTEASKINPNADYKIIYDKYITDYQDNEGSLTFYSVDLDDSMNKNYLGEVNISNDLKELKINDDTLFKIKNNEIDEYYIGNEDIIEALNNLTK